MEIKFKAVDVTPAMAEKWLKEKNVHNRPLYERTIEAYALDMKRGYWAFNHQPICFNEEGELEDGQQRLSAVVLSGKTIRFIIAYNWPKQFKTPEGETHYTQETVDGGKPRSIGDRLDLSYGISNANLKAALVAVIASICTNSARKMSPGVSYQVLKLFERELDTVLEHRKSGQRGLMYSPAVGAFVFAAKSFRQEVIEFEDGYFTGDAISIGTPVFTFRNYMLNRNGGAAGGTVRRAVTNATLTALMYHVQHMPLKRIITSAAGLDFFLSKQKRLVSEVCELFRL